MTIRRWVLANLFGFILTLSGTAHAETFRWAFQGDVGMMDPYGLFETMTLGFHTNIYEGLVRRGREFQLEPSLATAWEQTAPDRWRFVLRKGVLFHGGEPFTADDVVFSFERINKPGSDFASLLATIKTVEKIDDHTVDIVTDGPDAMLVHKLTAWLIMSETWTKENGAEDPTDVRAGKENYATRHANGTGPFKLTVREPDVRTVLVPFEDWWDAPQHNVTDAIFTPIGADATRIAALLSGELDMAYPVPLQDVRRVDRTPGVTVLQGPELRTIFLGMDQRRDELLESNVKGANPFKDKRVRMAMFQAIDIDAIERKIMRGAATPTGLMIAPDITGFDPVRNDRFAQDLDAARALMAEAGYGDGFEVGMDCPNDRYVNDEAICQAVAASLAKIGIKVNLLAQTKSKFFAKVLSFDTSFYLLGWSPAALDGFNAIYNLIMTRGERGQGKFNLGGYSNADIDSLGVRIQREVDLDRRNALIGEALEIHKQDVGHIPLHQQALAWGIRESIGVSQFPNNILDLRWVTVN